MLSKTIPNDFDQFLLVIEPFSKSLTIGVETTFNWYWFLDACVENDVTAFLGHALYIREKAGLKHKSDSIDASGIADMLRSNTFSIAYAYPKEMRSARDLLRRRHIFVDRNRYNNCFV